MKIKISPLFYIFAFFVLLFGNFSSFVSYVICLVLHEYAHGVEARKRGYEMGVMKLSVFGASLSGEWDGMKADDELAVAIAGPLLNLVLLISSVAIWWLFPSTYYFTMDFAIANFCLLAFNLLPAYPLDGGRIALVLLGKKTDRKKAFSILRIVALILAFALIVVFIISLVMGKPISVLFAGIFILISTLFPDKTCKYHKLYQISYRVQKIDKGLEVKHIAISSTTLVQDAEKLLNGRYYTCFILIDESLNPCGLLTETAFERQEKQLDMSLIELYKTIKTVSKLNTSAFF